MHKGAIFRIRTCYSHTCQAAGDGRPVAQACHALVGAGMAGLQGGDGEGALTDLQTRQIVLAQGKTSEPPGDHRRGRTHQAAQIGNRALSLNQGGGLRAERRVVS